MTTHSNVRDRVLALYPRRTGFAYAVLEGRERLVDWGQAKLATDTDDEFRTRAEWFIRQFKPTIVALEDCSNTRRGERTRARIEAALGIAKFSDTRMLATILLSPAEVRGAVALPPEAAKRELVEKIVEYFPELYRLKPRKRIWQRDPRMYVFEAVALALAAA